MNNKSYAVFGLGRYGFSVAKKLVEFGADVIAIDIDEEIVNDSISDIPYCKCADVTDIDNLKQLGIADVDVVVIAMANNLEASVMAIMLCKELGVETIIAKGASEMNCKILSKVGATRAVFPESESGSRLAKHLLNFKSMDIIELSNNVSILELDVKQEWEGKSLSELNLRKKYSVNVVAIVEDDEILATLDPDEPLKKSNKLIVIIDSSKINRIQFL